MKIRNLLPGFALAALFALGLGGTAHASDYNGDCANVPSSVAGNVNISDTSCSIGHSVTATGSIFISATSISASDLTASGGDVNLSASGNITAGSINSTAVASIASSGSTVTTGAVVGPSGISINADSDVSTDDLTSTAGPIFLISNNGKVDAGSVSGHDAVTVTSKNDLTTDDVKSSNSTIYINAEDGDISVAKVEGKNGTIEVLAYQGKIEVSDTVTGDHTTQVFAAQNTISLQDVVNTYGDVRIFANIGGGGSAFEIGSGGTNGVTSVHDNEGGAIIYIANGGGDINYSGSDLLQVQNSSGQAGSIVLDGQGAGTVTLTGDISADGSSGQRSGGIYLFAPAVVANGATLNANSPGQLVGGIALITNQITDNSGLTLNINGNGPFVNFVNLSITPVDSWSVSAPTDPSQPITFGDFTGSGNNLTITGAGDFSINADGNNNGLKIWGNSLTINTATTTITQHGSGNGIGISAWDGDSFLSTLTFGGTVSINENNNGSGQNASLILIDSTEIAGPLTGNVSLNASGITGGDGSTIYLNASTGSLSLGASGNNFTVKADGSSSGGKGGNINVGSGGDLALSLESGTSVSASAKGGNGNGGNITLVTSSLALGSGTTAEVLADGNGTGNGGTISIFADSGDLAVGSSSDNIRFSAKAGTSGNGGKIQLTAYNTTLTIEQAAAADSFDVTAGSNGNGGTIELHAQEIDNVSGGVASLLAKGNGTGSGGKITIDLYNDFVATGSSSDIALDAKSTGTGDGGEVNVTAANVTLDSSQISVAAGSNGDGGKIAITPYFELTLTGDLDVSGGSTSGKGGSIKLNADTLVIPNSQTFTADGHGAAGGTISIKQTSSTALDLSAISLHANGGPPDSEFNVDISYQGNAPVKVGNISTATSTGSEGGNIRITNESDNDLIVQATGSIDTTSSGGTLSGNLSLVTANSTNDNVTLTLDSSPGFQSVLSTEASSVSVTAAGNDNNLTLGLGALTANSGNISLCLDDIGSCSVASFNSRINKLSAPGVKNVECIQGGEVKALDGAFQFSGSSLTLRSNCVVQSSGLNKIYTATLNFEEEAYFKGASNTVTAAFDDLTINLPGGATAGFIETVNVTFETLGSGSISVNKTGSGTAVFALNTGSSKSAIFSTGGDITVAAGIDIGVNNSASNLVPDSLKFESTLGAITLNGSEYARLKVTIDNSSSSADVTVLGEASALGSLGEVNISAGGDLIQPTTLSGTIHATDNIVLESTSGNIGSSTQKIQIDAPGLTINAAEGGAFVNSGQSIKTKQSFAKNNLAITSTQAIDISENLTSSAGNILVQSYSGTITIDGNVTVESELTTNIVSGSYPTPAVPGTPASNVTVLAGSGTIFWGQSPGITALGTGVTVQSLSSAIVFECNGTSDAITLNGPVLIKTH